MKASVRRAAFVDSWLLDLADVLHVPSKVKVMGGYAALLIAFGIRVGTLARESFWRDEIDSVLFASVSWPELLNNLSRPYHNGSAFHILLRVWTDVGGRSEFAVRYLSTLADLVCLSLIVALGWRLGGRAVAIAAGALWAIMPATIWYAGEAKMYSCLASLAACCLYLAVTGAQQRSLVRAAGALALAVCGTRLHFFSALLIMPTAAIVVLTAFRSRRSDYFSRRSVLAALAGLGISSAIAGTVALREWSLVWEPPTWTGHPYIPWQDLFPRVLFGITTNTQPLSGIMPATLLLFVLFCSVLTLRGESITAAGQRSAFLWLLLTLPLGIYYLVSLRLPLFEARYFMVLAPVLTILLALGFVAITQRSLVVGVVTALSLLALAGFIGANQTQVATKADYRSLGAYLREESRDVDGLMVVMPYNDRAVRFYTGDRLAKVEPPPAHPGITTDQLEAVAAERVDRHRRLWLVRAESEQYDPDNVIARWLEGRAARRESHTWLGIRLDLYEW